MKNAIYMLKSVTDIQMNSFIVTTESGKVIAIDGGHRQDTDYFLEVLRALTGEEKPHIDAWFLSHPHLDHINVFLEIVENRPDALTFDRVLYNFPSVQFVQSDNDAVPVLRHFYDDLPKFAEKITICSGGDRYVFGEAAFDILCTADSELNMNVCNNSTMVFRMTLGGRTALFLGDCGAEEGDKLLRMYGAALKSDICQLAHHGQSGCRRNVYEAVSPKICLWCTPLWLWNNDAGKGYNTHTWTTMETRRWMDELGAETHYVMKDGTHVIEL